MIIGIPRERKDDEYRVGLTPDGVGELVRAGHDVLLESGAGLGISCPDEVYEKAGARIADSAEAVWGEADLVVKVKEPQAEEVKLLRPGQLLFAYLHLAASLELTEGILESGVTALAFETLLAADGSLPLLIPMSEVAGRLSIQEGAKCLSKPSGGRGILLGGIPGTRAATTVILGGGTVGANAARMAAGLGSSVYVIEKSTQRLRYLADVMPANVQVLYSTAATIEAMLREADLVVSSILIPGARAPKLVTRQYLKQMKPGSVIVDVAIDQGGSTETSKPTTHHDPVYVEEEVLHYCVTNMPGAMPITSSHALTDAILPYVSRLAGGADPLQDKVLRSALNAHDGRLYCRPVGEALGLPSE